MSSEALTPDKVRDYFGPANARAAAKQLAHLDDHCRNFIALSPFVVLSTANAAGQCDATPRGDAPGFVGVLDEHTVVLPDRPGNNRVDSFLNIAENPHAGLLFIVPGVRETLRINGPARIETDPDVLEPLSVNGKPPRAGIVVTAEEVFFHCAKAFIRSDLWNPEKFVPKGTVPTLGQILADQIGGGRTKDSEDAAIEDGYRTRLY